ncbi:hypothetical protein LR948_11120 [Roseivivax sp. GX 12232]|uniref:hypothetical protein n=1 Tax=Roseivivax sp. GX 12232 TaxID=2900547 RepID=UPI001E4A2ECF|nr:hypothetical protein [Roseivivax sp. GX 12232]MCE0505910.1 hypothetical protein [Roseivivax sp. GX 12232]
MDGIEDHGYWLGCVELLLREENPDLPHLRLIGQAHYGPGYQVAFIDLLGVDNDRDRRRSLRTRAGVLLGRLGVPVAAYPGCDVYDFEPVRPTSMHERLQMMMRMRGVLQSYASSASGARKKDPRIRG